ncbi:hypothetical protein [Rhizobium laguerreae]|uniref:hypothetical protein n=1 Tax=Rhizobium laguerreae TaxID=1076926 RepID=UPI001179E2C6
MRNRRSRSGRNPRNGTLVFIEEKWATFFRRGNEMQQHLDRLERGIGRKRPCGMVLSSARFG